MKFSDLYYRFRNSEKLKRQITEILESYEHQMPSSYHSCKEDLLPALFNWVKSSLDDIATWRDFDTDYVMIAHSMIVQQINSILGNFHDAHGINLSVRFLYPTYRWILQKCCQWGLKNGHLSQAEYDEYHFFD